MFKSTTYKKITAKMNKAFESLDEAMDRLDDACDDLDDIVTQDINKIETKTLKITVTGGRIDIKGKPDRLILNGKEIKLKE